MIIYTLHSVIFNGAHHKSFILPLPELSGLLIGKLKIFITIYYVIDFELFQFYCFSCSVVTY